MMNNILQSIYKNSTIIIFVTILIFLLLIGNNSLLYDQDEAAYAGFTKMMIYTGDYVVMDFPFSEPHRKPPLHFWISSIAFKLLGESEFSLRLFPSFFILLSCLLTYKLGKLIYNESVAKISFGILAFTPYFYLNGKIALVDSLLTFLHILSFYFLYLYFHEGKKIGKYFLWITVSLGALTKGPPIYIFIGGILVTLLLNRDYRKKIFQIDFILLSFLSFLPLIGWGYRAWIQTDGELIRWMIDWYVLRRATNPVFGQTGFPGTYLLLFFLTFFPWSFFLPKVLLSIYSMMKKFSYSIFKSEPIEKIELILIAPLLFGWIFYEFLMSKLPSYVLSVYPILSIFLANEVHKDFILKKMKVKILFIINIIFILTFQLFSIFYINHLRSDSFHVAKTWSQKVPIQDTIYFNKNYALPSLIYYLDYPKRKIVLEENFQEFLKIPVGSYLVVETPYTMVLSEIRKFEILSSDTIFLYDRNRKLELTLLRFIE